MIALRKKIIRIFQRFSDVVHASCRHDPAIAVICIQIDVVVLVQYLLSQLSPSLRVILASDSIGSVAGIPYLFCALDALRSLRDALTTSWTSFIYRHLFSSSYSETVLPAPYQTADRCLQEYRPAWEKRQWYGDHMKNHTGLRCRARRPNIGIIKAPEAFCLDALHISLVSI